MTHTQVIVRLSRMLCRRTIPRPAAPAFGTPASAKKGE